MSIEIPLPWPVEINLSRPAMELIIECLNDCWNVGTTGWTAELACEVDNFRNLLQNLLERETEPENLYLIGG